MIKLYFHLHDVFMDGMFVSGDKIVERRTKIA